MKVKELNAIKNMAQTLGYDAYNMTVEQATLLYNIIVPILDRELDINTSEI
jgi:Na+-translocating ferredoxin:NAD+ oxidoreductase RnfD subunit